MKFTKAEFEAMLKATVAESIATYDAERKKSDTALLERVVAIEKRGSSMVPPNDQDMEPLARAGEGEEDEEIVPAQGAKQGKVRFPNVLVQRERTLREMLTTSRGISSTGGRPGSSRRSRPRRTPPRSSA